jgi:hypothetical protein
MVAGTLAEKKENAKSRWSDNSAGKISLDEAKVSTPRREVAAVLLAFRFQPDNAKETSALS